ncbi:signal recognition particle SRP9 [Perkinsela sp. CCAP 1560/4]|nr:signal recognition particle SRP9 [Perkinsela sp. CCAP 1560/4]KNH08425.1 signal recognition particle SRP9 [Perkinsela sp. CCAP 1560/4]|eukprot:KNH06955.1 signal recognition particle SRP9 [Perkinsela sp. CCAP 1560/4]
MVESHSLESFGGTLRNMYEYTPTTTRFTIKHRPFEPQPSMFLKVTNGPMTFTYKVKPNERQFDLFDSLLEDISKKMSHASADTIHTDIGFDVETLFQEDEEQANAKKRKTKRGRK